jgi:TolB-like protein
LNLLNELKRRNVFKVGAAYVVVGWLVIEAAALLAPQLNLPEWAPRLVTFLVLIGLPIALVMAWVYDLTPGGLQREEVRAGNKRFFAGVGVLTVVALTWFFAGQGDDDAPAPATELVPAAEVATAGAGARAADAAPEPAPEAQPSIAVLPFVNMSPDPENEFFADGISEELLNILARIEGLKVASRTSSFSFKGSKAAIPSIAEALQVAHVLEGSVRKQGERVRITAQLIHARSDAHLWSDTYDRELTDIFLVQEEIAQAITTALEGVLGTRRVEVKAPTRDLEAYQRFLQGRSRFFRRAELDDALADFQFAVERDPAFAEAWALLAATAQVHSLSGYPTQLDRAEIGKLVEPAVERALALESRLPLVLAVKGYRMMSSSQAEDRGEGLTLMERAAATEVGDSTARMWLGLHWLMLGRIDKAELVLASAHESDPLVPINAGYLGVARFMAGQEAEGERLALRALELGGWPTAAWLLSTEFANRGEFTRSAEWVQGSLAGLAVGQTQAALRMERYVAALRDPTARPAYLALLEEIGMRGGGRLTTAVAFADPDAVFEVLGSTPEWLDTLWVFLSAWLPSMEWLRHDPRFFAFAEQLGYVGLWDMLGYPLDCRPVEEAGVRRLACGG